MRKSLALLSALAVSVIALSAVPTTAQAHWWWYGTGSSGSGTGGSTNTSTTSAGFSRTYVSPGGDDANGCSVNDPCRTFQRAHDRAFINGEINCTEAGGYGPVAITKSITIDCKEVPASINAGTANAIGVSINIPTSNANDPLRVVRLRGFTISGAGGQTATATAVSGTGTRVGSRGISIVNASAVYIEHLVISDFVNQGIADTRTGGTKLFILDTVVRNNNGVGITPLAASGSNNTVVLDNVRSEGNLIGLAIGIGNNVVANRSVFSGNSTAGVEIDLGGSLNVNGSVMSHNGFGVQNAGGTVRLSNNDIAYNATAIFGASFSFGNNRLSANTAPGVAPTAVSQQ